MTNTHFRSIFRGLGLLTLVAMLSGCASSPNIVTNSDPSADFMNLRTFDFMQPLSTDRGTTQTLLSSQLIAATTDELQMRGWRHEPNNPDVLINFLPETQEQMGRPSSRTGLSNLVAGA